MLIGLDPLLGPDLLSVLRAMGHGDEIVVVDANFPASATAKRLCRADGVDAVAMVRAILSVMPLDDFGAGAAFHMQVVDAPDEVPAIVQDFAAALNVAGLQDASRGLERQAFYARARNAYAIVATGETRLYGNLLLVKGVVRPR